MSKKVFIEGKDGGYVDDPNFWLNPAHPDSFRIAQLDDYYPADYFQADHVSPTSVEAVCKYVPEYFKKMTGQWLASVGEFGAGGGWFTERFIKMGYGITAIEGSEYGIMKMLERGITWRNMIKQDLRISFQLADNLRFDIGICTEVAEHIEIPFSGVLVENLVRHSDLVWFSFEGPDKASRPHLHHPNEQPAAFWINLFYFHNYGCLVLPENVFDECQTRGRMIFFNREAGFHV